MKSFLVATAAFGFATLIGALPALAWEVVGVRTSTDRVQDDQFRVNSSERFESLMICAYDGAVLIAGLDVNFRNGSSRTTNDDIHLNSGECTNSIALGGRPRNIESINITNKVEAGPRRDRGWGRWSNNRDRQDRDDRDNRRDRDGRATIVVLAD